MIVYSFNSEAEANAAERAVWVNRVKEAFGEGKPIRDSEGLVHTLEGLTDPQIAELKICGYKSGEVQMEEGLTTAYVKIIQAYERNIWYFLGPIDAHYLAGVTGYTEQERPADWLPPSPF